MRDGNGDGAPVLRARGLRKEYGRAAGLVRAVDGADLAVTAGETLAVMGPSGWRNGTPIGMQVASGTAVTVIGQARAEESSARRGPRGQLSPVRFLRLAWL